mgnify:CR=1 FL=1
MSFTGHTARKRFGQHWLRDARVLDQIVEAARLQQDDRVLEVGPGRGALTERLLASPAAQIHAIELDRDLVQGLHDRFGYAITLYDLGGPQEAKAQLCLLTIKSLISSGC